MPQKDWSEYYKVTESRPPRPLLIEALRYVKNKDHAIDLGAGALNDTKYLLSEGFDVTVVDKSPIVEQNAKNIFSDKVHSVTSAFEDFDFPKDKYDLATAMYSLPFINPSHFVRVFKNIIHSLKSGGVFCGQLFGDHDEWKTSDNITFHTKSEVEKLLKDLEVILLKEEEKDEKPAVGEMKHWHVFHFIVKKK